MRHSRNGSTMSAGAVRPNVQPARWHDYSRRSHKNHRPQVPRR